MNRLQRLFHVNLCKSDMYWGLCDAKGRRKYNSTKQLCSESQNSVVSSLEKDGIVNLHLTDFLDGTFLSDLYEDVDRRYTQGPSEFKKKFLEYYVGGDFPNEIQKVSAESPFIALALNQYLTTIISSYLRTSPNLCYVELNRSKVIASDSSEVQSQRWHRDPAIRKCVKVFVYWNDVTEDSGPFQFIPGTHYGGRHAGIMSSNRKTGGSYYPDQKSVQNRFGNEIFSAIGPKGTVVIADTSGLHRGGYSKINTRDMSTFVYYPNADFIRPRVQIDGLTNNREQFGVLNV